MDGIYIRPSKDLRTNYSKISELAKNNPVAITVNGREDTVVLSHGDFMAQQRHISELEARLRVYEHLAKAQDDIKLGRVQTADDALNDIIKDIGDLDI